MTIIPLYNPLPALSPPPQLSRVHYREAKSRLEATARSFFMLPDHVGVMAFPSATAAFRLWFQTLRDSARVCIVGFPTRTYRSVFEAAALSGLRTATSKIKIETQTGIGNVPPMGFSKTRCVTVPTTLGGTKPKPELIGCKSFIVYDCAHTCHPVMFEGVPFTTYNSAILSFYPTKPAGAFGGGLFVATLDVLQDILPFVVPTNEPKCCHHLYPHTVQSWAMEERLRTFDLSYHAKQRELMQQLVDLLYKKQELRPLWPRDPKEAISPHQLVYARSEVLEGACELAQLETGNHYPTLQSVLEDNLPDNDCISIPFHTPEVHERLEKVL